MGNPVVHFEIGCADSAKAQEFYTKLFDWAAQPTGPVAMIATGSDAGIQGHISTPGHDRSPYTIFYVHVDDVDACLKKAESLGGKTIIPTTAVQNAGHFAWLADPEGNTIGLWKPKS